MSSNIDQQQFSHLSPLQTTKAHNRLHTSQNMRKLRTRVKEEIADNYF